MKRIYLTALATLFLDQASKYAIRTWMHVGQSIPLIPRLLNFTYVRNAGAAFGILAGKRIFFIVSSLVVIGLLLVYSRETRGNAILQTAFGLMLGGAVGNLVDRALLVWVTDFIDISFFPPTFNLADSALVVGVALFALDVLSERRRGDHSGA